MPKKKKRTSKAKPRETKKKLTAPARAAKKSEVKRKAPVKKSTAPKKKPARVTKPIISPAQMAPTTLAGPAVTRAIAPQEACLPMPAAIRLVRSCSGAPDNLPLDTQLGVLIPSQTARNSFCQCVANGVPKDRSEIPCGATNTLQDVVDAIAC
jgi:hypothetical protein